jgi:hypothetical protein
MYKLRETFVGTTMKRLVIATLMICGLVSSANAYDAFCTLKNGKEFNIHVSNKVMVVDQKWKVFFKGKTWTGWYEYENKGYKYVAGTFKKGKFPIEVTNKYDDKTYSGTCYLK